MTNEQKFKAGKVLYKNDNSDYVLELWGGSTNHPDSVFHMKDFDLPGWVDKNDSEAIDRQVFQWLLECASKLNLPQHAADLARWALDNWYDRLNG